jgi:hypothetical protein
LGDYAGDYFIKGNQMANSYQSNPLSFTAAGVSLKNYLGPKYFPVSNNGRFLVKRIVWVNPAANGDTFTVTDNASKVLATGNAVTATVGIAQTTIVDQLVTDVLLSQISSGTVLIYIDQE